MMVGAALLVFTAITVGANQFHFGVPVAVTVALIIATMKGSMVASIFMHLSHEKKWIYGALILTVLGFLILMTVPIFTINGHDRHARAGDRRRGDRGAHGALNMSLRAFHLFFIALSVVLAAFFAAWAGGQYRAGHQTDLRRRRRRCRCAAPRGSRCTARSFSGKPRG